MDAIDPIRSEDGQQAPLPVGSTELEQAILSKLDDDKAHSLNEVAAAAGRYGVDVAIEAAGTNDAVETAIHAVRPGGTVVLAGIPADARVIVAGQDLVSDGDEVKPVEADAATIQKLVGQAADGT